MNQWNFTTCAAQVKDYVGRQGIHAMGASPEFTDELINHLTGRFSHMAVEDKEHEGSYRQLINVHRIRMEGQTYIQIDYIEPKTNPTKATIVTL